MAKAPYKTKQMTEILTFLKSVQGRHVTVNEICDFFREKGISIGTTTIYRQLEKMVKEGLVAKYVIDGSSSACFEYIGDHGEEHENCYHCKCEKCGKLIHLQCNEVEILKVASVFDTMTAMKFEEEPMSEITALRYLLDGANGYDQLVVQALVDSINVLQPGVCVDLSNGDKGLVITENPTDILHPFVLSFRDNQILNLADSSVASGVHIVDIMKTMDNRHIVDHEALAKYKGETVHLGEARTNKHY